MDPQKEDSSDHIIRQSVAQRGNKEDWATIDWLTAQGQASDAQRRRKAEHSNQEPEIRNVFSSSQGMWSAVAVGLVLGILGVVCEASTKFVVSFRIGICANYFWLGREQCCAGGEEDCENFYTWGQYFGTNPRHQVFTDFVFYVFWTCVFATTAAVFCKFYNVYAAGGGINEVKTIVSGHSKSRYLGSWTLATKALAMCFSTGSGLAIGKEGPFVHIGASAGYIISHIFPEFHHENKRRELIAAGAAGGVAVAFGAPVGGVIFSLEEISSFYNFKALMQALVTGVVAVLVVKKVDMFHTGRIVQFSINYTHAWHWFELPLFALIGVMGGLVGSLFNITNIKWCRVRKQNFKQWKVLEVFILALISATLNFIVPYCKSSMLDMLENLFQDCTPGSSRSICQDDNLPAMVYMIIAGTFKILLCALTVGSAVPAGLLVPSLVVGALYGRAFGLFFQAVQATYPDSFLFTECFQQDSCIIPGAYAIVGSAAVLCGVTRMTICLAVIMFELTGGLEYLVPVIVTILASKATGDALGVESIFEMGIEENKFPYLDPKKEFFHEAYAFDIIKHVLQKAKKFHVVFSSGMSIRDLNDLLEKTTCTGYPVVVSDTDHTLLGYITAQSIKKAMTETATRRDRNVTASTKVRFSPGPTAENDYELDYTSFVDSSVLQVEPNSTVQFLLALFKALGTRMVIVTKFSKFEGIITKKDLITFMRVIEHDEHALIERVAHSK